MEKGCVSQFVNVKPACTLHVSRSKHGINSWSPPSLLLVRQPAPTPAPTVEHAHPGRPPSIPGCSRSYSTQPFTPGWSCGGACKPLPGALAARKHHRYRSSKGSHGKSLGRGSRRRSGYLKKICQGSSCLHLSTVRPSQPLLYAGIFFKSSSS